MATFAFKGESSELKVSSSPWITMFTEHAPDVLGCCAKESFDGWPTVTFDLVRIHEGMNRNYEIILDYEITGNDFSKSHTIQLVTGWNPKKQAFVTHCCIMNEYLQPKGWCQGDFPEDPEDIQPFTKSNRALEGPELLIGPYHTKPRLFIEFPQEVFKKLRLVRGIQHLGPEPQNVNSVDMRVLLDLQRQMTEEEQHQAVAVGIDSTPTELGDDATPY